jgi:hypothetical protein
MLSSPFDTVAQRIKQELREAVKQEVQAYQWIESRKGRVLSSQQAWTEWNDAHREDLGQFLKSHGLRVVVDVGFERKGGERVCRRRLVAGSSIAAHCPANDSA